MKIKQVGIQLEIAHGIKQLNDTLDMIGKERRDYSFKTIKNVLLPCERRYSTTTSFVDESEI